MTDLTNPIFNDPDKAREHLEGLRWPNGAVCPHCGACDHLVTRVETTGKQTKEPKKGKHRPARKGLYYCNSCTEQFTVQVGTVLEKSHIPLNKWLAAFYLI
jgi:transposase-like protein